jgi:hypothetical protein
MTEANYPQLRITQTSFLIPGVRRGACRGRGGQEGLDFGGGGVIKKKKENKKRKKNKHKKTI